MTPSLSSPLLHKFPIHVCVSFQLLESRNFLYSTRGHLVKLDTTPLDNEEQFVLCLSLLLFFFNISLQKNWLAVLPPNSFKMFAAQPSTSLCPTLFVNSFACSYKTIHSKNFSNSHLFMKIRKVDPTNTYLFTKMNTLFGLNSQNCCKFSWIFNKHSNSVRWFQMCFAQEICDLSLRGWQKAVTLWPPWCNVDLLQVQPRLEWWWYFVPDSVWSSTSYKAFRKKKLTM